MLTNLHVKNLALIEEADIDFKNGLNILSGETGAGKSIIIGSINYCLGAKASGDVIRSGSEYALAELTFSVDEELAKELRELEFPVEDDGTIILSRKIMDNRSVFKINGENHTARQVKELATYLIDIHGQHEHQSLLSEQKQKELLDDFAGDDMKSLKNQISKIYEERKCVIEEIDGFTVDEASREREISLIRYELDEINAAALKPGEEEELSAKHRMMQNSKKITEELSSALNCLDGEDSSALSAVGYAVKNLVNVAYLDSTLAAMSDHITGAEQVLIDAYREIKEYLEDFSFEAQEFDEIEQRLDVINKINLKYGGSYEAVTEYAAKREKELEKLEDSDNYLSGLRKKDSVLKEQYDEIAGKIHELRCKTAEALSKDIEDSLKDLNFLKVNFDIEVKASDNWYIDGKDKVVFVISLNPGQSLMPLSYVASGGELSRIMLALKEILARRDHINTLIFDEIDTGISGVTAWQVSKKMGSIAKNHQVICITHLPQIAAMADAHYLIEKSEQNESTVTNINELDADGSLYEVARLLGGDSITEAVLANAHELMDKAKKVD